MLYCKCAITSYKMHIWRSKTLTIYLSLHNKSLCEKKEETWEQKLLATKELSKSTATGHLSTYSNIGVAWKAKGCKFESCFGRQSFLYKYIFRSKPDRTKLQIITMIYFCISVNEKRRHDNSNPEIAITVLRF